MKEDTSTCVTLRKYTHTQACHYQKAYKVRFARHIKDHPSIRNNKNEFKKRKNDGRCEIWYSNKYSFGRKHWTLRKGESDSSVHRCTGKAKYQSIKNGIYVCSECRKVIERLEGEEFRTKWEKIC